MKSCADTLCNGWPGVGKVAVVGSSPLAFRLWLHPGALETVGCTDQRCELETALPRRPDTWLARLGPQSGAICAPSLLENQETTFPLEMARRGAQLVPELEELVGRQNPQRRVAAAQGPWRVSLDSRRLREYGGPQRLNQSWAASPPLAVLILSSGTVASLWMVQQSCRPMLPRRDRDQLPARHGAATDRRMWPIRVRESIQLTWNSLRDAGALVLARAAWWPLGTVDCLGQPLLVCGPGCP